MPELRTASATLRLTNEERRSVFSVGNVSPSVSAETAAGFVNAVKKKFTTTVHAPQESALHLI